MRGEPVLRLEPGSLEELLEVLLVLYKLLLELSLRTPIILVV